MDDKYQPPKQHPTISVKLDDWLAERKTPQLPGQVAVGMHPDLIQLPANATPEQQEEIREQQNKLREDWRQRTEIAQREHLLDKQAKECLECGDTRRQYTDDYMCYRCRDSIEEESNE
jgi:hypothetical protein